MFSVGGRELTIGRIVLYVVLSIVAGFFLMAPLAALFDWMRWPQKAGQVLKGPRLHSTPFPTASGPSGFAGCGW